MTDDIPASLGSALAERYELRRLLGRGGMASVYLAFDKKHHRQVALKVLLPGLVAFLGAERFLKEIEIAAHLTHPHILALYDSGEADGQLYYVMPYVDGGSLRQVLQEEHRLSPERAMAVATPVAGALAYAHRMGILHRDIKPENILFSQGHPVVADFGIAKAVSSAGGVNLTRTGFPIGTPGYMSPEQAAGLTDLDARSDVYSLAVVIYEMLMGELPGRWPTEDEVRAGTFAAPTAAQRRRLTDVGSRIEAALVRGLAIRLDQRTSSPAALIEDLTGPPVEAARRRYSEGEVREIVRRAAEQEASTPTQSGSMTIGGVEALAAEVGIAPEVVRSAAHSLARPTPGGGAVGAPGIQRLIGGPTRILFERVVPVDLPDEEFPTLVEEIRRILQNVGHVSQLGRSFTWTSATTSTRRSLEVAVSVRAGQTRIIVQENLSNLIGGIFGGIGGGMGGGGMGPIMGLFAGLHMEPLGLIAVIPLWLATTFTVARTAYSRSSRRRAQELEQVADSLAALVRELVPGPALRRPDPRLLGE